MFFTERICMSCERVQNMLLSNMQLIADDMLAIILHKQNRY